MPMYFKLYRNPENKSLVIPRAALQLSDLTDTEELTLHTGGGYLMAARSGLSANECLHLLQFLTSTASSLLLQLAADSHSHEEYETPNDEVASESLNLDGEETLGCTIPLWLLKRAGLDDIGCLEAVAEDGRVIVTASEDEDPDESNEEDPLKEFDAGFRAMLVMANVDLNGLRMILKAEDSADE